jgi:hypothetical protein
MKRLRWRMLIQSEMTVPLLGSLPTEIDVRSCPTASSPILGEAEQKFALLAALRTEIHSHDVSHFVDEPPSVAYGLCRGKESRPR